MQATAFQPPVRLNHNVQHLRDMRVLEVLRLQGNRITALASLDSPVDLPRLRSLWLRETDGGANPLCERTSGDYRTSVCSKFPRLRCVDGHYFTDEGANPRRISDNGDEELVLPKSVPWATESYFVSSLFDTNKVGYARSEANLQSVMYESSALVSSARDRLLDTREPT